MWSIGENAIGMARPDQALYEQLSREEAEAIIMQARLKIGWITEADLAPPAEAAPEAAEASE